MLFGRLCLNFWSGHQQESPTVESQPESWLSSKQKAVSSPVPIVLLVTIVQPSPDHD